MVRYSVAPRFRFGNSPWRWNDPPVIADAVGSAARPRLPDSVGCEGFSVRRALPVRCLSAVIRLAVLGKVGPRLAGNMPGRMSVCCHEKLLPVLTCCRAIGCDELSARLYFLIFLFVV